MPDKSTTKHRTPAPPYSQAEVGAYFRHAWAQSTVRSRDPLLALLDLGLGVGMNPTILQGRLLGTDVLFIDGIVYVQCRSGGVIQNLVCLRRFGRGLLDVAGRAGNAHLLGTYRTGVNATGNVTGLIQDSTLPPLNIWRLMATYRRELAVMFNLPAFVQQLGTFDLDGITALLRTIPPPSLGDVAGLLAGDRDDDGPWAPGWTSRGTR